MAPWRGRPHGFVVRPYILTGGRTEPSHRELALETLVSATTSGIEAIRMLEHEEAAIVRLCETYQSVAEIAAHVGIPLGVARVLVSDLASAGHVRLHRPPTTSERPDGQLLRRVLHGLRSA
ncbi:DUF742 domain-containing protein [Frankia sp. CNm7]|uniref:DUF742 domain-containing protein n=1 Tax=Frankia nepalensis TaxID=1836974 RepID=A0A937RI86_9ACTN|nr:DUF742 domain-containing protein [Frankia nepalensis]MBL7497315.1 DUF742 domain-containing protein [Frankia nepalensis]MBL7509728.1 DUF742 domain-containing protein [Frankia nepalensis]MBL7516924.1 DUF742 domain-containing protein [Frankia nepalensis]MBL7629455.1 DUF742 domain-containing protein [Frankia nepalensis]